MPFPADERDALLQLKGVGPTVIKRLEEIGINSLLKLKDCQVDTITEHVAAMLHANCWKNSPQAKAAIAAAIELATQKT